MPAFDVTANPTRLSLKPGTSQTVVVTVTNRLGRAATARADKVVTPPAAAVWVKAPPDAQRPFSDQPTTQEFRFEIAIPANATPQTFTLRVDVVEVGAPGVGDENFGRSEMIGVTISAPDVKPVEPGKGIPVWVWPIVAVVVIGIGIGIWLMLPKGGIPKLVKKTRAEAVGMIDTTKILAVWVDTLNADTVAFQRGVVIEQKPEGGSKLKAVKGVKDTLRIVVQKSFTVVPPLANLAPNDAVSKLGLDSLGFVLAYDYTTSHPPDEGKVTRSDPAAAALVARGTPVRIFIRTFSPPCTPPSCRVFNPADIAILMQLHTKSMKMVKTP